GEYTALVASGSLALEDAVRLVRARGSYMQKAVPEGMGAMAAVLKLDAGVIERVAREVSGAVGSPVAGAVAGGAAGTATKDVPGTATDAAAGGDESGASYADQVVETANYNAPGQTVLSGSRAAVE